ncbi:acyl carrier protein [Mucilaginibacter pedocola]|uniref:Acyl carrier protein n=1 Tax=Mucilaginibacter pedocola TaxID=1792845 RepID=A0A1S9PCN7_9SPHI|nr:acyl carrier protein [Mucilaginibacter pedocola]OOQ58681.1 acyl carrier protein [Mucilaginibacter pedocola]
MERQQIIAQLNEVFRDTLDNDDINLTDTTIAKDVEDWDSLNHIQLVVAIEKKFKIRFTAKEIHSWENVGQLVDSLAGKL